MILIFMVEGACKTRVNQVKNEEKRGKKKAEESFQKDKKMDWGHTSAVSSF
jgi:hypothetical protein